jgi:hypothetical protein
VDAGSSPAAGAPQCGKVDVAGHGGGCNNRASTLATLAEDSYEFTRLLPRSDLMDAVLRGDEAAMRNPVLNDTAELARSLWPNCSARPAGALIYYTVRPHATGTGSTPYFWGGGARGGPPAGAGGNRPRHGTGRGALQDCPKGNAQPQLVQVLREWIRRATRGQKEHAGPSQRHGQLKCCARVLG